MDLSEADRRLGHSPFYWGVYSSDLAEQHLSAYSKGTFLLRYSESSEAPIISWSNGRGIELAKAAKERAATSNEGAPGSGAAENESEEDDDEEEFALHALLLVTEEGKLQLQGARKSFDDIETLLASHKKTLLVGLPRPLVPEAPVVSSSSLDETAKSANLATAAEEERGGKDEASSIQAKFKPAIAAVASSVGSYETSSIREVQEMTIDKSIGGAVDENRNDFAVDAAAPPEDSSGPPPSSAHVHSPPGESPASEPLKNGESQEPKREAPAQQGQGEISSLAQEVLAGGLRYETMTRHAAEDELLCAPIGYYLIRPSSQAQCLALTYVAELRPGQGQISHLLLQHTAGQGWTTKGRSVPFEKMRDLLESLPYQLKLGPETPVKAGGEV